ncbi:MAG: hypothetical protein ACREA5_01575 [Nitrosotalea sp.]
MNEKLPCKDHQLNKISSKSIGPLKILGLRSREDLIEEWLSLNPKDVTDFDREGIKKITTQVTITFDFGKEEYLLAFQPLK